MNVTIAICSHNRAAFLRRALDRIAKVIIPDFVDEIVIVLDACCDDSLDVARSFSGLLAIRIIEIDAGNLSRARNAALDACGSEWIAFLDDDAIVAHAYFAVLRDGIRSASFGAYGGVYLPWYRKGSKILRWPRMGFSNFNPERGHYFRELDDHEYFSGGISVFNLSEMRGLRFRPQFGMNGKAIGYGEEVVLQIELRSVGVRLGLDSRLRMYHFVAPQKQTLKWQLISNWRRMRFWRQYFPENAGRYCELFPELRRLCWRWNDRKNLKASSWQMWTWILVPFVQYLAMLVPVLKTGRFLVNRVK